VRQQCAAIEKAVAGHAFDGIRIFAMFGCCHVSLPSETLVSGTHRSRSRCRQCCAIMAAVSRMALAPNDARTGQVLARSRFCWPGEHKAVDCPTGSASPACSMHRSLGHASIRCWYSDRSRRDGAFHTARFAVDATGRAAVLARSQHLRSVNRDRLVGCFVHFEDAEDDGEGLMIETFQDGWWYSAGLPEGRRVIACMSDADVMRSLGISRPAMAGVHRGPWRRGGVVECGAGAAAGARV
jgi:hypothetical protein